MLNTKKYRKQLGLSQAEIARRLGISRQTFNNYELGKREADYEMLLKIAEELQTSVQDLLRDNDINIKSTPIIKDRSAFINRVNSLSEKQFDRLEGYLDSLLEE